MIDLLFALQTIAMKEKYEKMLVHNTLFEQPFEKKVKISTKIYIIA